MLVYEASRTLPLAPVPDVCPSFIAHLKLTVEQLQSPIAPFTGYTIPLRIGLSPILRAGIGMTEGQLYILI